MKHPDQAKRESIPTRESVPTMFHPYHDLLMVVPIPDIDHVGTIILPDKARILMNEGHIIEKGPRCTDGLDIGDCVTWDANSEYRMNVDGVAFVLVREGVINMRIPRAELGRPVLKLSGKMRTILTEGENEAAAQCIACGEWSLTSHAEDIIHAAGCPERLVP